MSRYASNGGNGIDAAREFKHMVKTLHQAGIEVILDVVYNHTGESTDDRPNFCSFRGIDNANPLHDGREQRLHELHRMRQHGQREQSDDERFHLGEFTTLGSRV